MVHATRYTWLSWKETGIPEEQQKSVDRKEQVDRDITQNDVYDHIGIV